MSMKDSIAGLNPAVVIADSSCAEGQLKKRLNIWSKSLRKSNRSWKKLSRGIRFAITASWGELGGAGKAIWSWGQKRRRSSRSFLLKTLLQLCQEVPLCRICMERGGREEAGRLLDFVPVFARVSRRYVLLIPAKGASMDQMANWLQSNWYELGSLVAQFTFLFAGLWFAGKILKAMRATQQQMGALLRLSMTDGLDENSKIEERSKISEV